MSGTDSAVTIDLRMTAAPFDLPGGREYDVPDKHSAASSSSSSGQEALRRKVRIAEEMVAEVEAMVTHLPSGES